MKSLEVFEKKIGQELPASLKQFLSAPRELQYHTVPTIEEFVTLEFLFPGIPPRALPFLYCEREDEMTVLCLPRGHAPFIGLFGVNDFFLGPWTQDIDAFLNDLPNYGPGVKQIPKGKAASKGLFYNFRSATPALELLKPLSFNTTYSAERDSENFKKLTKKSPGNSPVAAIIHAHVNASSVNGAGWWFKLADSLSDAGFATEAIAALENSHTAHFVCGHDHHHSHNHHEHDHDCNAIWAHVLETYERLAPLVEKHGDGLDRLTIKHQTEAAREMSSAPCTHDHSERQQREDQLIEPVTVQLDICLADVLDATDEYLAAISGQDEEGHPVQILPLGKTTDTFFVELGEAVGVGFELPDEAPLGDVFQVLAIWLEEDYLAAPARYRTKGLKLKQLWIKQLKWSPGDEDWQIVFEVRQ